MRDFVDLFITVRSACSCSNSKFFDLAVMLSINLTKVMIYLLTSCNTEERVAQNIYIHISNRKYKKLTTTTLKLIF